MAPRGRRSNSDAGVSDDFNEDQDLHQENATEDVVLSPKEITEALKPKVKTKHVVYIKPVETSGSILKSNLNGGKVARMLNGAIVVMANQKDDFGHSNEFITEDEFNTLVKKFNPRADYHQFIHDYYLRFTIKGLILDITHATSMVQYKFCLRHSWIAKNKSSVNPTIHQFYIEDELLEARESNKKMEYEIEAFYALRSLSPVQKRDVLKLYGVITETLPDEVVTKKLRDFMSINYERFLSFVADPNLDIRILLSSLAIKGLIKKKGTAYYHHDILIGYDEQAAIQYLVDGSNIDMLLQFKQMDR